jgi:hypothetical protein
MKKVIKKLSPKAKSKKITAKLAKKPAKAKEMAPVVESQIHNTAGAEMPNPAARNRPYRRDVRMAFRK